MSKEQWVSQIFQTSEAGVSSAFEPELIPDNQLSWMKNGVIRGGKPHTRTPLRFRLTLPRGKLQGAGFFSVQNGMLVVSIDGLIYRIRIGTKTSGFSYESIPLPWRNSSKQDFAWMQETVGYLVIQDGQSNPIIYDGSVARRSDTAEGEVPLGRQMAYGNGRLWVAINEQELVAGDIKTRTPGSELLFTETQYLTGGGAFYFPHKITGLGFMPATGAAGYGSLIVYAKNRTETIRADITNRDLWGTFPGFIQPALLNTGAASHFSLTEVNQDLWWRDGQGGIRSLRSAVTDEASGPGNTPQSREVVRITDFEDQRRLDHVSAIQFNNRLLMTASPFINEEGSVSFKDIISLDFSPISSNRSKTAPSYDGEWEGLQFTRLIAGEFNGKQRGFALTLDPDGYNRLWEFDDEINDDELQICTGTGLVTHESPIPMVLEYPSRDFGTPGARKVLQRCDVYLAGVEGEVALDVYWRSDNLVKWNQWQEQVTACAVMEDGSTASPHVWKNLAPQGRAQIKTFSIPQTTQALTGYGNQTGFEHQIRIVVTGKARVDRVIVHASVATQEQFALRDNAPFSVCAEQDITGNEIIYDPVSAGCSMNVGTAICDALTISLSPIFNGEWSVFDVPDGVDPSGVVIVNSGETDNATVTVPDFGRYDFRLTAGTRVIDYPVEFSPCDRTLDYFYAGTSIITGGQINFGEVDEGDQQQLTFRIENNSEYSAEISSIDISPGSVGFSIGTSIIVPFMLDPGDSYDFPIIAQYVSAGTASATLLIESDALPPEFSALITAEFIAGIGPGSMFKEKLGDTYAYFPAIPSYVFNDFTIEIWVYVYSSPSPDNFGRIVDHSFSNGFDIQVRSTNRIFFEILNVSRGGDPDSITLDTWQHFAFRRTGTLLDILKNGTIITWNFVSGSPLDLMDGGAQVKFGASGGGEILQEKVSDFRIWNYARSDAEILANYDVRLTGEEAGLACYYTLSESDSIFRDRTGMNVPLTLLNGSNPVPNSSIGWVSDGPPPFA